jgi:hypothetical protein
LRPHPVAAASRRGLCSPDKNRSGGNQ